MLERACREVPAPGVSASKQSQEIPERLFEAQEQTSHIFPHRTRQAANKTSFPSPGSKALKPPFNVKRSRKPVPPLRVLGVYVAFQQAQKCSAVTGACPCTLNNKSFIFTEHLCHGGMAFLGAWRYLQAGLRYGFLQVESRKHPASSSQWC